MSKPQAEEKKAYEIPANVHLDQYGYPMAQPWRTEVKAAKEAGRQILKNGQPVQFR